MTNDEKARAYDEALKWMRELYPGLHGATKEDAEHYFPALRESEEETTRKELLDFVRSFWADHKEKLPQASRWVTYLEKQKEIPMPDSTTLLKMWDDEEKMLREKGLDDMWRLAYNAFLDGFARGVMVKQKEQKEEHFELKSGKWYICHRAFCCRADHLTVKEGERFMCEKDGVVKGFIIKEPEKYFKECSAPAPMEDKKKEQKPAWGEEDEKMLNEVLDSVTYAFYDQGNEGEIEDDPAFLWLHRLRPSWKPSEQEKGALRTAIHVLTEERSFPKAAGHLQAILDAFEGKESRKDWKPSEEQMEALQHAIDTCESEWAYQDEELRSLLNDLYKL